MSAASTPFADVSKPRKRAREVEIVRGRERAAPRRARPPTMLAASPPADESSMSRGKALGWLLFFVAAAVLRILARSH